MKDNLTGETPGAKLRALLAREGEVPSVLSTVSALQAKVMELCGVECGFVGTALTVGNYTGFPDSGVASSTECLTIGGYIARSVLFPVILDGDTGHGGIDAVQRLVTDSIREGLAALRLDDQPIEDKRPSGASGILVVDKEAAVARYRAAVDMRDKLDPSFVIMAQCYARDAVNGGLDDACDRIRLYCDEAGVDWVQMEHAHSTEEILRAGRGISCYFSAPQGRMPQPLSLKEHAELGLAAAWYTFAPARFLVAEAYEFLQDFRARGVGVWTEYLEEHRETFEKISRL